MPVWVPLTIAAASGALVAYFERFFSASLYIGRKICSPGVEKDMPRGLQSAVFDEFRRTYLNLGHIAGVVMMIWAFTFGIRWGLLAFFVYFLCRYISGRFCPRDLRYYVFNIHYDMLGRCEQYRIDKDMERANAARAVLDQIEVILQRLKEYETARGGAYPLPNTLQAREVPLGGFDDAL